MKKRILAMLLASTMIFSFAACAENGGASTENTTTTKAADTEAPAANDTDTTDAPAADDTASEEGKVLRIYCWNDEFQSRFNDFYAQRLPEGIEVEWVITANEGNAYQDKLDTDLPVNSTSDNPIDIFLIEADYALKYVNAATPVALDIKGDIGLTDADLAGQYQYTKDIVTDSNGVQRGTTWQATPGLFAYRRSIAKDVLGTDDPAEVQAALADWDKFDAVAKQAADKGYKMLSGYDDSYRTFSNNVAAPWVDANNNIIIDDNLMRWVDQTKLYTDSGYNNKTGLWSTEWSADQGPDGKVFGFFYSTWGINFTLLGNSLADANGAKEVGNGIYGDWAVCEGPQAYYWGGTWICAAAGTDNPTLIKDVMYYLSCDKDTLKSITEVTQDYTNSVEAMNELATSDYGFDFLGGQNHIALFSEAAPKIDMSKISAYDQGLNEEFQGAFKNYFDGNATKEEALEIFYTAIAEKYPSLNRVD